MKQPICVGALIVGIIFNLLLVVGGWLGLAFLEALYLSIILLTIVAVITAQWLIWRSKKDVS